MSAQHLRVTIILLVGAFALTQLTMLLIFQPLIAAVQCLSCEGKAACFYGSSVALTAVSIAAVLTSLAGSALALRGGACEQARRWIWIVLLAIGVLLFIQAAIVAVIGPKFTALHTALHRDISA